jgi:hypothetical protein
MTTLTREVKDPNTSSLSSDFSKADIDLEGMSESLYAHSNPQDVRERIGYVH